MCLGFSLLLINKSRTVHINGWILWLGEVPQRKRSKSEDLDGQSSKRRRFEGEEYEAELKVKITAGDDLNRKLQKV